MNCIKTSDLQEFWIQNGKRFTFINKEIDLPITEVKNRKYLESIKASYKTVKSCKGVECLQYWDSEFETYEEKTAPLFHKEGEKLVFSGKNHTGSAPTREMYIMAELKAIDLKYALKNK